MEFSFFLPLIFAQSEIWLYRHDYIMQLVNFFIHTFYNLCNLWFAARFSVSSRKSVTITIAALLLRDVAQTMGRNLGKKTWTFFIFNNCWLVLLIFITLVLFLLFFHLLLISLFDSGFHWFHWSSSIHWL